MDQARVVMYVHYLRDKQRDYIVARTLAIENIELFRIMLTFVNCLSTKAVSVSGPPLANRSLELTSQPGWRQMKHRDR